MAGQLDNAHVVVWTNAGYFQRAAFHLPAKRRVKAVITMEFLIDFGLFIGLVCQRTWGDFDRLSLANQGTGEQADE